MKLDSTVLGVFLSGGVFIAALVSSLFFLRFWRDTRDRFFLFFALAFLMLSIERLPRLIVPTINDFQIYFMRVCAFTLILGAIYYKNRSRA